MLGIVLVDLFRAAHQLASGRRAQCTAPRAAVVQTADRECSGIAVIAQQPSLVQGAQRPAGAGQCTAVHRARRPAAVPEAVAAERHLRHMLGGVEGAGCGIGRPGCRKAIPVRADVGAANSARSHRANTASGSARLHSTTAAQRRRGAQRISFVCSLSASLSFGSTFRHGDGHGRADMLGAAIASLAPWRLASAAQSASRYRCRLRPGCGTCPPCKMPRSRGAGRRRVCRNPYLSR